jgi:hypothetical protein
MSHIFYYGRPLHVTHAQLGVPPIRPRVGPPDTSRTPAPRQVSIVLRTESLYLGGITAARGFKAQNAKKQSNRE